MMKRFRFFPLWEIENLEDWLKKMEQSGYILDNIKYSYFFSFRKTSPKNAHYFITNKSFRGESMGTWDYALQSNHKANPIKTKMCFYSMYRTKEPIDELTLLLETRLDFIKRILLQNALTALSVILIFASIFCVATITASPNKDIWCIGLFMGISACFTIYYTWGYLKLKGKCKRYTESQNTKHK